MSIPNRKRREELRNAAYEMMEDDLVIETGSIEPAGMTYGELRALLDALDRRTAILEAYASGEFGVHEWFMQRVTAELEQDDDSE